jgi:hypothetical protein
MNVTTKTIATNPTFQAIALSLALQGISEKTGIAYETLIAQFETNQDLQTTCAKIAIESARLLAKQINGEN